MSPTPAGGVEKRLHYLMQMTLPISIGAGIVLFATGMLRGRSLAAALGAGGAGVELAAGR
ncbi:MAG: hypothetical protein ACRDTH_03100 [Pseudonocardiaceae bacterium]